MCKWPEPIKPSYAAALPWFGPVLIPGASTINIGAACDPALGNALAAVLVPVRKRQNGGFSPAMGDAWVAPISSDDRGRFCIAAPLELWQKGREGLLLALLYDRSMRSVRRLGHGDAVVGWADHLKSFKHKAAGAGPISHLPPPMQDEIGRRVRGLLEQPHEDQELAVIESDAWRGAVASTDFAFALASCQYPAGFLDADVAGRSYQRLAGWLDQKKAPRPCCLLLVGDQVYVDATAGLFDPKTRFDRFELPHERLLRMRGLRQVLRRLPVYTMLDDHEIEDNWEPTAADGSADQSMTCGRDAYVHYQRIAGPPLAKATGDSPCPLWYEVQLDGFPFFIADTRTERTHRSARTIESARIMSEVQFGALVRWLKRRKQTGDLPGGEAPGFIASPAALLPRHRRALPPLSSALRSDSWEAYPASLQLLLAYLAEQQIHDLVFLSGDEHISFITRAVLRWSGAPGEVLFHSIHSSALYAPFPFANSIHEDLAAKDPFDFTLAPQSIPESGGEAIAGGHYVCELHTRFAPAGDGFAIVRARRAGAAWRVSCRFVRGATVAPLRVTR
jgi:PhoD-like phosphatase